MIYCNKFSGKNVKTVTYPQHTPKFNGGGELPANGASHKSDPFSPQATLRRAGYVKGWDEVSRKDGLSTFKKENSPISNFMGNTNPAVSNFDVQRGGGFPHAGAKQNINHVLGFSPNVQKVNYGEVDFAKIPGYEGNNSGVVGDAYQFQMQTPQVGGQVQDGALPAFPSPQLSQHKMMDVKSAMYTPDGMTTSQYLSSLRARRRDAQRYNEHIKIVNKANEHTNQMMAKKSSGMNKGGQYAQTMP